MEMGFPAGDTVTETIVAIKLKQSCSASCPSRLLNRQFKPWGSVSRRPGPPFTPTHLQRVLDKFMLSLISRSAKYSVRGVGQSVQTCLASRFHAVPQLMSS